MNHRPRRSVFEDTHWLDISVLLVLTALIFGFDHSLDFGRSLGAYGVAMVLGSLTLSVLAAAVLAKLTFAWTGWSSRKRFKYVLAVGVMSLGLHHGLQVYADQSMDLGRDLVTAKIEYFCHRHFDRGECVRQVNLCSDCVLRIDKWMRSQMAERLEGFRERYPADAKDALAK